MKQLFSINWHNLMFVLIFFLVHSFIIQAKDIKWDVEHILRQTHMMQYHKDTNYQRSILDRAFDTFQNTSKHLHNEPCGIKDILGVEIIGLNRDYLMIEFLGDSIYGGFFEFIKVQDGKLGHGLCDLNGDEIIKFIPDVDFISFYRDKDNIGYFLAIKVEEDHTRIDDFGKTLYQALYDIRGNCIVPLTKVGKYSIFSKNKQSYLLPYNEIKKQVKNKNNKLSHKYNYYKSLAINKAKLYNGIPPHQVFMENTYTEKNGYSWILVKHGLEYGAKDVWGKYIIPLGNYLIEYKELTDGLSCFKIEEPTFKNPQKGILSLSGKAIVPYDSYIDIQFHKAKNIGGYFEVSKVFNNHMIYGIYMLNGNNVVKLNDFYDRIIFSIENDNFGHFNVSRDDRYGAYDIYGNVLVPLGVKGDRLHYGKYGFYFDHEKNYTMGLTLDEYGAADYSLRRKWDKAKKEKEEAERRKKEQRRVFWTNFGNALTQSASGYLGMMSQPMARNSYTYSMPSFSSNQNIGPLAQQMSQPEYFNNVYQELMFTSMVQVQQQEMWEYNQARQGALAMGKDLTLDEWRSQQGAALMALKEQGIDVVAEQKERDRQKNREWRESLSQDSKDRLQRIRDYNQMKYGRSSSSFSNSSTNKSSGPNSHPTSQGNNYNTKSYTQSSTSRNSSASYKSTQTKMNDSHQQYENGNNNVNSSDYTYIQRVTLYRQDGSSFKVAKQNAELYEKGAVEYIKIGGTFFPAQNPGRVTEYRKRIVYGGVGLYYN